MCSCLLPACFFYGDFFFKGLFDELKKTLPGMTILKSLNCTVHFVILIVALRFSGKKHGCRFCKFQITI